MVERLRRWLEGYPVMRRVIVNTKTDKAFGGVVWRRTGDYLVLRQAALLQAGSQPKPLDGELLIFRGDVDFVQVV